MTQEEFQRLVNGEFPIGQELILKVVDFDCPGGVREDKVFFQEADRDDRWTEDVRIINPEGRSVWLPSQLLHFLQVRSRIVDGEVDV
jgi:hypothetical protein